MPNANESTPGVRARPILLEFDIGDDVAEFDERLSSYFVETSSFRDIITDKADLILGAKGSGKSAIFKHLANPNADIPELNDVDIIPAFNVQGSVIFRRLSASPPVSASAYRFIWVTFIVAMISNHLLSTYASTMDLDRLAKLIDAADLRVGPPFPIRLWEKVEKLIKSISERLELEGELEFGIPKLPVRAKGKARLNSRDISEGTTEEEVDLEEVLFLCADHLTKLQRRCWVVFDRLDEAFEHSHQFESTVLHGLMRAHLDLASYGSSIRTKLFLRHDIMDRVMRRQGFVNATHLRRLNLQWDREGIVDLIARRIAVNESAATILDVKLDYLNDSERRLDACCRVLPRYINDLYLMQWIERFTTDASAALNPRNVLTLVKLARQHQLEVYDRDDPELESTSSLISAESLMSGFKRLSETRLQDTIYAEFNTLRSVLECLRSKPPRFTRKELAAYMRLGQKSSSFRDSLERLEYAGIVSISPQGFITVAQLYRPALGISLRTKSSLSALEIEDLHRRVDAAIQTLPEGVASAEFDDMETAARKAIYRYVLEAHPGYSAFSVADEKKIHDLRTLVITRKGSRNADKSEGLQRYDEASIELLEKLRARAAEADDYFLGPMLDFSHALTLIEIDHRLRKNKARRRIVGLLASSLDVDDLDNSEVQPIFSVCHAWIIDPFHNLKCLNQDLQDRIHQLINSLIDIATHEKRLIVMTFSCSVVKSFAASIANQNSSIQWLESETSDTESHSGLRVILKPSTERRQPLSQNHGVRQTHRGRRRAR